MSQDMEVLWENLSAKIAEIDEEMDSWNPETGLRRNFLKDVVASQEEGWKPQAERLSEQLKNFDEAKRFGLYLGLVNALNDTFKKEADAWIEAQVAELPKPEKVEVSAERKEEVTKSRSEIYGMMKQLRDLAQGFNFDYAEAWELPKIRRGGAGKRGPRALTLYTYFVDGKEVEVPEDKTSQAALADALGMEKASSVTKYLKDLGVVKDLNENKDVKINTSKPPAQFEFEYEGKKVQAVRDEDEDENGEEEETSEEE